MILCITLILFFSFRKVKKILLNLPRPYKLFKQHSIGIAHPFSTSDMKNDRALQNIPWICLNVHLNYGLLIYFLVLHVKITTVQKISQLTCVHYMSGCFHAILRSISQISYHFQKHCFVKAIQNKYRAELFVLNGRKKPIRYEFHNGVKRCRHNGNMVSVKFLKLQGYTKDPMTESIAHCFYNSQYFLGKAGAILPT